MYVKLPAFHISSNILRVLIKLKHTFFALYFTYENGEHALQSKYAGI